MLDPDTHTNTSSSLPPLTCLTLYISSNTITHAPVAAAQDPGGVMFEVCLYLEPPPAQDSPSAQGCPAQEEARNRGDISLFFKYFDWQVGLHTVYACSTERVVMGASHDTIVLQELNGAAPASCSWAHTLRCGGPPSGS